MKLRTLLTIACVTSLGVAGLTLRGAAGGQEAPAGPRIATPPEVTLQNTPAGPMIADVKGFTLYVTDRDKGPEKSTCYGPCAEQWPPLRAAADAKPFGDWSLVPREDGQPQWAYKGRPLYRYRWELKPGWAEAQNEVWRYALLDPFPALGTARRGYTPAFNTAKLVLPPSPGGISGQTSGHGIVFADAKGMTLYSRSVASACTGACLDTWVPLRAPQAASPVGDWTIVTRSDGTAQWVYQGKPVYRSSKDFKPTDTNGASDEWHAILVPSTATAAKPPSASTTRQPAERPSRGPASTDLKPVGQ